MKKFISLLLVMSMMAVTFMGCKDISKDKESDEPDEKQIIDMMHDMKQISEGCEFSISFQLTTTMPDLGAGNEGEEGANVLSSFFEIFSSIGNSDALTIPLIVSGRTYGGNTEIKFAIGNERSSMPLFDCKIVDNELYVNIKTLYSLIALGAMSSASIPLGSIQEWTYEGSYVKLSYFMEKFVEVMVASVVGDGGAGGAGGAGEDSGDSEDVQTPSTGIKDTIQDAFTQYIDVFASYGDIIDLIPESTLPDFIDLIQKSLDSSGAYAVSEDETVTITINSANIAATSSSVVQSLKEGLPAIFNNVTDAIKASDKIPQNVKDKIGAIDVSQILTSLDGFVMDADEVDEQKNSEIIFTYKFDSTVIDISCTMSTTSPTLTASAALAMNFKTSTNSEAITSDGAITQAETDELVNYLQAIFQMLSQDDSETPEVLIA